MFAGQSQTASTTASLGSGLPFRAAGKPFWFPCFALCSNAMHTLLTKRSRNPAQDDGGKDGGGDAAGTAKSCLCVPMPTSMPPGLDSTRLAVHRQMQQPEEEEEEEDGEDCQDERYRQNRSAM